MKVYIGPYRTWWGPYQLANLLQHVGVSEERCHQIGEWLSNTWVQDACQWVEDRKHRKVQVRIDKYDTWNVDSTLAIIILPLLRQLQATKHGSPFVDDEDVPENLRSTSAPPRENEWDTDALFHDRWTWVMSEIIWTFEQLQPDNCWEDQYFDRSDVPTTDVLASLKYIDQIKFDKEGRDAHQARINNGLRLFGKYYQGLWD